MQILTLSSNRPHGQLPDRKTSMRLRAFRFLSERYAQRERPSVAAEFILFALITLTAARPLFTRAHVLSLHR
jgi:hypothetical protein